jgi:hypothetical protein
MTTQEKMYKNLGHLDSVSHIVNMTSLQSHLPVKLIRALYGISREKNPQIRARVLEASLKEVLRWFTVTARQLLQGIIQIPHQTKRFFDRNKVALTQLADPRIDTQIKKQIILKPGGSGSLGGVIIRSLLKWDPNAPKLVPKTKATPRRTQKKKKKSHGVKTRSPPQKKKKKSHGAKTKSLPQKKKTSQKTVSTYKRASPKTSLPAVIPSSSLAAVAAAHKVPAPKIKVQERSGMLQSLLDMSNQELARFSPLRTPSRRVLPVIKLIRRKDNQWRRIPV